MSPTVKAEAVGTKIFGHMVSDLQEGIEVDGTEITGTLKYCDSGALATDWGAGYFLVLKFSDIDASVSSILVGLDPSVSSGLVELINDPDKNGVFKITDKNTQVFKMVTTDGTNTNTNTFKLNGLKFEGGN